MLSRISTRFCGQNLPGFNEKTTKDRETVALSKFEKASGGILKNGKYPASRKVFSSKVLLALILLPASSAAFAQSVEVADSVTFTGIQAYNVDAGFGCGGELAAVSDGSVARTPGICLALPTNPDFTYVLNFSPADNIPMEGVRVWSNAGNSYSDDELQQFDVEVDYLDPTTGNIVTLFVDDANIGDTVNAGVPLDFTFPVPLFRVTQVRILDMRGFTTRFGTTRPGSVIFREVQAVFGAIAPEIDVSSGETGPVADGGPDDHAIEPAGVPKTVTYTVENTGLDTMTLFGPPQISGLSNITDPVTVTAPVLPTLETGESTTFTVTYTPTIAGPFGFDIDVLSNDADEGTYDIAVEGVATGDPEISVVSSENGALDDGDQDPLGDELFDTPKVVTYTITNDGLDTLELTGLPTVSGATNITGNDAGVVVAPVSGSMFPSSLAPGETAEFTATFTPDVVGPFDFDIDIPNNDANEGPYDIAVLGNAIGNPEIGMETSNTGTDIADGGTDTIGGVSQAGTERTIFYTIVNDSDSVLTLGGLPTISGATNITGDDTGVVVAPVGGVYPSTIASGDIAVFTVTYTPELEGPFNFDIVVLSDDADEAEYNIAVEGEVSGEPEIMVETSNTGADIADGGTDTVAGVGEAGVEQTITYTVTNDGTGSLALEDLPTASGAANITGGDTGVVVTPVGTYPDDLAPGETAEFTVTFTPALAGPFDFDIAVPNDDADEGPYEIAVAGNVDGDPEILIQTSNTDAEVAHEGTDTLTGPSAAGVEQTITYTIINDGTDALALTGLPTVPDATNITGDAAGVVVAPVGTYPTSLEPGEEAEFTVTFTPTDPGAFGFDIVVPNDDADEAPYDIAVQGNAASNPEILIETSNGNAEIVDGTTDTLPTVGDAGVEQTVTYTITNEGTSDLALTGLPTVSGAANITSDDAGVVVEPVTGSTFPSTLAPGETAEFTVTFTPELAGSFDFDIAVPNDDADEGPYDIAVAGNVGGDPEILVETSNGDVEIVDGTADTLPTVGEAGVEQTVTYTVTNEGTDALALTGTPTVSGATNITGDDAGVVVTPVGGATFPSSLAPGETAEFTVTYTPTNAGSFDFDIVVPNDDANEGPYDIAVAGNVGGDPEILVETSNGDVEVVDGTTDALPSDSDAGVEQTITYTIINEGTDTLALKASSSIWSRSSKRKHTGR